MSKIPDIIEVRITAAYKTAANHTYVCPHCGWQWARLRLRDGAIWVMHTKVCGSCPKIWPADIPGSLVDETEAKYADGHGAAHLPREALIRELELHLREFGVMSFP